VYAIKDFQFLGPSRFTQHSELGRLVPWVFGALIREVDAKVLLLNMGTPQSDSSTVLSSFVIIGLTSATVNFSSVEPKQLKICNREEARNECCMHDISV
jgi:hypothetical protein